MEPLAGILIMNSEQLKKIRRSTGLTQVQFGKEIQVSGKLVQMMEQGLRRITPRTAQAIMLLLPRIDNKKGVIANETPYCPFCGQEFVIQKSPKWGKGYHVKKHFCTSGVVQIKTNFATKSMLQRALTPVPRAMVKLNETF